MSEHTGPCEGGPYDQQVVSQPTSKWPLFLNIRDDPKPDGAEIGEYAWAESSASWVWFFHWRGVLTIPLNRKIAALTAKGEVARAIVRGSKLDVVQPSPGYQFERVRGTRLDVPSGSGDCSIRGWLPIEALDKIVA